MPVALRIFSFGLLILYVPNIAGAATSPRWILLALAIPIFLIFSKPKWNLYFIPVLLFLVYCFISLLWGNEQSIWLFVKFFILFEAFVLGSAIDDLAPVFEGFGLGITVSSFFVVFAGYSGGLFININTLAELSVLVLAGLIVHKLWYLIPTLVPALLFNGSRGAIFTTVCVLISLIKNKLLIFVAFVSVISALVISVLFEYRVSTVYDRLTIWKYIAEDFLSRPVFEKVFGYGLGSFNSYGFYNIFSRPMYAHNDLLQTLFDVGIVGMLLLICVFVFAFNSKYKLVIIAFIIVSFYDFPLYLPVSSFLVFLVCGHIAASRNMVLHKSSVC